MNKVEWETLALTVLGFVVGFLSVWVCLTR